MRSSHISRRPEESPLNTSNKPVDAPDTPMKLVMKKVSSGRRMNSGAGDTLTFGARTFRQDNDLISESSGSGI